MRYNYTPIRNEQNPEHQQYQMRMRTSGNRNSHALLGMQNGTATLKGNLAMSYKVKPTLIIHSNNHIPLVFAQGIKILCPQKICTQMFLTTLFIITKTWKQSRYPLVGE